MIIHLWSPSSPKSSGSAPNLGWTGYRTLPIQTQRLSVGSSCLYPISGLSHVKYQDALVVSLFDGSFHVIQNLSHEPMWSSSMADGRDGADVEDSNATFTSEGLSAASRTAFTLAERRDIRFTDVNRISGMLAHDDASGVMMWLHEYVVVHSMSC